MAVALKRENPARTATQVRRILRAQMGWAPGERTLQRHFADDPQIAAMLGALAAGGPGSEAVFGRFEAERPERVVDRGRPARPDDRRAQDLPVRVPRRPLPGDRRAPVRVRRGHRPPGRRAAPRAGLARGPGRGLRRQRLGVRRRLAAAGLRQARDPADPLHPGPPAGPREDRAVLPHRPRAVPRRDHRRAHHRRRRRPRAGTRSPIWTS